MKALEKTSIGGDVEKQTSCPLLFLLKGSQNLKSALTVVLLAVLLLGTNLTKMYQNCTHQTCEEKAQEILCKNVLVRPFKILFPDTVVNLAGENLIKIKKMF